MPRTQIELDQFRGEIERRIASKHTQPEILNWLARKGAIISRNTLSSRVNAWATDRNRTASSDTTLVSAVDAAFHTSQHNDQTIANTLSATGLATTQRQVKRIRLANGWRRRANNDDQLAEMRAQTFALTKEALQEGVVRCYGRGLLRTYLRIKYQHHAREDDVRDALTTLDTRGTESRRKGPDKGRKGGEFITPGPD
jgi:hypothetical protein